MLQIIISPAAKFLRTIESLQCFFIYLEVFCYIKCYTGGLKQDIYLHGHNTRSKLNFDVEFYNTVLFRKSVVTMGIKLYNQIPESIKKFDDFKLFKEKLKSLLLSHSFVQLTRFSVLSKVGL